MRELVMPSIRSREVARSPRPSVRRCEDALKALDFGNRLLGAHSGSLSGMSVATVKRSGICNGVTCYRVTFSCETSGSENIVANPLIKTPFRTPFTVGAFFP